MIFTSGPLTRNQVASESFKRRGANNCAPCSVGEVRCGPVPTTRTTTILDVVSIFYAFIIGLVIQRAPDAKTLKNIFTITPASFFRLFPMPSMAVSLSSPNETSVAKLTALGFSEQSQGRLRFYVGPSSESTIRDVVVVPGVQPDTYAPRGYASLNGVMTLEIINKALFYAFQIAQILDTITASVIPKASGFVIDETNYSQLPNGIFFPYFDGLLLADRGSTITDFITIFSRTLGDNVRAIMDNTETLVSGWPSVANTAGGRAASHAIWCLKQSLAGGFAIRPVMIANEYSGCVFFGKVAFFHLGKVVGPSAGETISSEIASLMSHNRALETIAGILSNLGDYVDPHSLVSVRTIHRFCRDVSFTDKAAAEFRAALKETRFTETMWALGDHEKIAAATKAIANEVWLPNEVPMYCSPDAVMTKDHTYSALAAFGVRSFSFTSKEVRSTMQFSLQNYRKLKEPGSLAGVPVFLFPLQEAYELWKVFLNDHTVKFTHKGVDKAGKLRVSRTGGILPFTSKTTVDCCESLEARFRQKKRKAESDDRGEGGSGSRDTERAVKRIKTFGGLFAPASAGATFEVHDEDMQDDDAFFGF